jgi:hypothetical protein
MKSAFLLIAVVALLVALGLAQAPAASPNPDQTNIKGCLGGSDGNYTVVEDNTGHLFRITNSSFDLKPHLGHDVALIGHKASGVSPAAGDSSFAVTELNMISEHCAAVAAATVTTPAETAAPPAADAAPPAQTATTPAAAASAPVETVSTPSETATIPPVDAAAPAATTSPVVETAVTPVVATAAPAAAVSTPAETTVTPAARPRKRAATPAAAATIPAVTDNSSSKSAGTPPSAATPPPTTSSPSSDPASTPDAAAPKPAATSRGWTLWLWIAFAVLMIVIGTGFPFFSRWRKQKSLERTGAPNLSFNPEVSSNQGKSDKQGPRRAA